MRDYEKWTWAWSSTNAISIYEPTVNRTRFEVATLILEEDGAVGSHRATLESNAQLICDSVNIAKSLRPFPEGGAWTGVDLDGTLAEYDEWRGVDHIGAPIPLMVERVKRWLRVGRGVAIFTARVSDPGSRAEAIPVIEAWCREHLNQVLPITFAKDFQMIELWDDRAIQVVKNTGRKVESTRITGEGAL